MNKLEKLFKIIPKSVSELGAEKYFFNVHNTISRKKKRE